MQAVIMAGGEGTRLRPYTQVIPKPLLPVGEKPILEIVVEQLRNEGFEDLIITTGYQGDLIKAYFQDGSRFGVKITYTSEEKKMGTVGALSLINRPIVEPFLVINGDILTDLSLRRFMAAHRASGSILTIAVVKLKLDIPYGVVKKNGHLFQSIEEKPQIFFDVGAGIYGVSPQTLRYIPAATPMDFPFLIKQLKSHKEQVACYAVTDYWKDIGILEDFASVNLEIGQWSPDRLYHRGAWLKSTGRREQSDDRTPASYSASGTKPWKSL